jgi:transposase
MEDLEAEIAPVQAQIAAFSRRQPGCKALQDRLYGAGVLVSAVIWAFLGGTRRFSSSAKAVRHTGLDITVYSSDGKRTPGPPVAPGTPDPALGLVRGRAPGIPFLIPGHAYYADVAARIDANRAALSVARKITRRAHHILRGLGDQAFTPVPAGR